MEEALSDAYVHQIMPMFHQQVLVLCLKHTVFPVAQRILSVNHTMECIVQRVLGHANAILVCITIQRYKNVFLQGADMIIALHLVSVLAIGVGVIIVNNYLHKYMISIA